MSSNKKKAEKIIREPIEADKIEIEEKEIIREPIEAKEEPKKVESAKKEGKYKAGSIVFVKKEAEADLNGFKLFPQYKKYAYAVEAYDANTGVYTLRRLNLSLKLKEADLEAPEEHAHDPLNRKQF